MTALEAPIAIVEAIAEAMKVSASSLSHAKLVEVAPERRNDRGWPVYVVAARLVGSEFTGEEVGTWATGAEPTVGPVFALNPIAREYTTWGEAARAGSRADAIMRRLANYPEATEAEQAVQG